MGYAHYEIMVKGKLVEAGYGITAKCDRDGCTRMTDRGVEQVCGPFPGGVAPGCGGYFCDNHLLITLSEDTGFLCPECHEQWKKDSRS